jgi:hypothetical protein
MPLNPLHNDYVRPPEGAIGVVYPFCAGLPKAQIKSTAHAKRGRCWLVIVLTLQRGHERSSSLLIPQIAQTTRSLIPSGGRVEVLWRGAFGMDAKRGTMGQGWPTVTTLGTAPERGKLSAAKPVCRARFLFGYFLFRASKEKVTRRKGETSS